MTAALTARLVAAARIGFGAGLVLAPGRLTSVWLGPDSAAAGTQTVSRGLGARDIALGAGALAAPDSQLRAWVLAGVAADAADLVATVAAGESLPRRGRLVVGAVAGAGVALGAAAWAQLGSQG
jgi:hypothetical protein